MSSPGALQCSAVIFLCALLPTHAQEVVGDSRQTNLAQATALFTNGTPVEVEIQIDEADVQALKKDSRKYVRVRVREKEWIYTDVGLHLKGSAGSFRQIDDAKPAFTLSFNQFNGEQRFHGLRKIHLNNSVQDASYLNELLAGEMFRTAGVPATRTAHAMVSLNGKQLGLYVLKESFTKDFLAQFFKKTNGNLYDMDPGREITEKLKKDMGDGPDDWSDLKTLAEAAAEPDGPRRWERLDQVLDLNSFVNFMAMEIMTWHWDGYCLGRNNFRIYSDRDSNKLMFFPHGTDQLFQNATSLIRPNMQGLLAQAVMRTPQGRRAYRQKFATLFTNVFDVTVLTNKVDTIVSNVIPALTLYDKGAANEFRNQAAGVKERIVQRAAEIRKQLALPDQQLLPFANNVAKVSDWRVENAPNLAKLDKSKDAEGRSILHIVTSTNSVASWRSKVILEGGHYRFEGIARAAGIVPLKDEKRGNGAGLRISQQVRTNSFASDNIWAKMQAEFDAASPDDEIELVCELRAQKGEVWFDADSLKIVRLK